MTASQGWLVIGATMTIAGNTSANEIATLIFLIAGGEELHMRRHATLVVFVMIAGVCAGYDGGTWARCLQWRGQTPAADFFRCECLPRVGDTPLSEETGASAATCACSPTAEWCWVVASFGSGVGATCGQWP